MKEKTVVEKKRNSPPRGAGGAKKARRYTPDEKLKAVRLRLEEGFSVQDVCGEMGMAVSCLHNWIHRYQKFGEVGLQMAKGGKRAPKLPAPITEKIVELKQQNPGFGIKRISQLLRRCFFLPASPETVRRHLHEAELMPPTKPPKQRNITRPRFFERATPNQMWQTDIFTFRLGGRYAYLIAFMDDYSRFIVGADLFRSPTANAVIEVYRVAIGEYQPPKEMLTDNGRQYTSWRGTSRFEAELKKDHVAHFKSRPQHPMTLGKVERFWSTIWQDFLVRAQFDSFEAARERIKLWIKHYNHKRPNQGIEGLCPADRFFEIQSELRQTIEAGIQENLLELALRGKPQAPFYMVGRMDGQSVVLRAEKGKLKLSVSDQQNQEQELVYDLNQDSQRKDGTKKEGQQRGEPQCPGQGAGGTGGVDGTLQTGGGLPATQHQLDHLQPLATPGDGRNAPSPGEQGQPDQGRSLEPTAPGLVAEPATVSDGSKTNQPVGTDKQACQPASTSGKTGVDECQSQTAGGGHLQSPLQSDDGHGGSPGAGHQPPAILPVGTTGPASAALLAGGSADGPAQNPDGPGEASSRTPGGTTRTTGAGLPTEGTPAPVTKPMGTEPTSSQ
jgi:transposase InsO family protein/transposase-like protein